MSHKVKLIGKTKLNHDVMRFQWQRPVGYQFVAGQAIELYVNNPVKKGPGPFTFTSLNSEPYLELTIKIYEAHNGLTASLAKLNVNDEITISNPWDSFVNKGPGIFIAGGAGITPFVALLRQMYQDGSLEECYLYFANKTTGDIFLHNELKMLLGDRYVDVITREEGAHPRVIDEKLLSKHTTTPQPYYVCGPPGFVDSIQELLQKIGATQDLINVSL